MVQRLKPVSNFALGMVCLKAYPDTNLFSKCTASGYFTNVNPCGTAARKT
jgi:hypothetical protein